MEAYLFKRFAILFAGALLSLQLYFTLRYRKSVSRMFAGPQVDKSTFAAIEDALRVINTESQKFTFSMRQLAIVSFRGERIFFVKGLVGQVSGGWRFGMRWSTYPSVFAVGDSSQSEWMRNNSEVFTPAFTGSTFSVFWVRLSRIRQRDIL